MKSQSSERWHMLTRSDITGFDDLATELVLLSMELGAEGRISRKGHAIIRAKNGETLSFAPTLSAANRGAQNAKAQFRRVFGRTPEEARKVVAERRKADAASRSETQPPLVAPEPQDRVYCPAPRCAWSGATQGALYTHLDTHSHRCDHPGCLWACDSGQGLSGHKRIVHEGQKPRLGKKKIRTPEPKAPMTEVAPQPETEEKPEQEEQVEEQATAEEELHVQIDHELDELAKAMKAETKIIFDKPESDADLIKLIRKLVASSEPTEREKDLQEELESMRKEVEELQATVEMMTDTLARISNLQKRRGDKS